MAYDTGNRGGSLSEHLVSCITLEHAALNAALSLEPPQAAEVHDLIAEIWRLAEEFESALVAERSLNAIRERGRIPAAGGLRRCQSSP